MIHFSLSKNVESGDICEIYTGSCNNEIDNSINSGTSSNSITFWAYNNEQVYINGLQEIQGTWSNQGNNIWKISANETAGEGMY